jgi:hypothetical protein
VIWLPVFERAQSSIGKVVTLPGLAAGPNTLEHEGRIAFLAVVAAPAWFLGAALVSMRTVADIPGVHPELTLASGRNASAPHE